jgi:hypothetical protein
MRITNAFLELVLTAVEVDPVVAGQFMRVTAMVDPPARLLRPSFLLRVVLDNLCRPTGVRSIDEGFEGGSLPRESEISRRAV